MAGSVGKGACSQTWEPEFISQDLCSRKSEMIPTWVFWSPYEHNSAHNSLQTQESMCNKRFQRGREKRENNFKRWMNGLVKLKPCWLSGWLWDRWVDVRIYMCWCEDGLDKWIDEWADTDYVGEKQNKEAGTGDGWSITLESLWTIRMAEQARRLCSSGFRELRESG